MPSKRKNTPTGAARKAKNNSKKENPSLNLLLKRLDQKIDQRFDALDRKIDAVDGKVDAVDQKVETVDRKGDTFRQETAENFVKFDQKMMAEFRVTRADIVKYYSQIESDAKADKAELHREYNKLLTGMDPMTRNYQQFTRDRDIIDAEHQDLKRNVETLKKRDMEKAAAIEKIEKEIDKLKAA